jgi:hypothetical protein
MTRTFRKYNRAPLVGGPGFKGWFRTEIRKEILESEKKYYNKSLRPEQNENPIISYTPWVAYHPYKWLCMGKCPMCCDPQRSTKHRRLINKRDLRQTIKLENSSSEPNWDLITRDPLDGFVDIWYDYLDWLNPLADMAYF